MQFTLILLLQIKIKASKVIITKLYANRINESFWTRSVESLLRWLSNQMHSYSNRYAFKVIYNIS